MDSRELTYELDDEKESTSYDTKWRNWAEQIITNDQRILILENQLRAERRALEKMRIERDLANVRVKQFERMSDTLAGKIDELLAEVEKLLRPTKRAA